MAVDAFLEQHLDLRAHMQSSLSLYPGLYSLIRYRDDNKKRKDTLFQLFDYNEFTTESKTHFVWLFLCRNKAYSS